MKTRASPVRLSKRSTDSGLRQIAWWAHPVQDPAYASAVLKGVLDYISERQKWILHPMWDVPDAEWPAWQGDGVLACCDLTTHIQIAKQMRIPIVDVSSGRQIPSLSWVDSDQAAVGTMAAEHFLERGLTHFGFCGTKGWPFSDLRQEAFVRRIQKAGFSCAIYDVPSIAAHLPQVESIAQWLATLPKPVGVMSSDNYRGRVVLTACRQQALAIPEEVAVLSVMIDADDPVMVEKPTLSFVRLNTRRIGYEAAALLDRLMSGNQEPPGTAHLIAPRDVVTRQSSDMFAIPDQQVSVTLRYIWQHACEGIRVDDLLKTAKQSRRELERRFRQLVGRTPHEEILRVQMVHVKRLLSGSNLSLDQIAQQTGFSTAAYLATTFHREIGVTPGKYRATHAVK